MKMCYTVIPRSDGAKANGVRLKYIVLDESGNEVFGETSVKRQ